MGCLSLIGKLRQSGGLGLLCPVISEKTKFAHSQCHDKNLSVAAHNFVRLRYNKTNLSQFPGRLIAIPVKRPPPSLSAPCSRSYRERYLLSNVWLEGSV